MERAAGIRTRGRAGRTSGKSSRSGVASERAALAFFRNRLRALGRPERARWDNAYLKSDLRHYGTTVPNIRRVAAEFARTHRELTRADLRRIAKACYATNVYELRSVAIVLLGRRKALLEERDLSWLLDLVDASNTWAHVDWLAVAVIGDVVGRHPSSLCAFPRWAKSRNFWVRRTALLAQHDSLKRGGGDFALFSRLAASMLDEREFFIRKAIGWVLREVSKKRPRLVYEFLRDNQDRVSRLTLQEGAKYLSAPQRARLGLPFMRRDAERILRRDRSGYGRSTKMLATAPPPLERATTTE